MASLVLMTRQWLADENGNIIMGEGRQEILEHIERTGSINKTAKIMKMSYKAVWSKIRVTEGYMNVVLVQADRKRGSRLTKEGKDLLEKYTLLKKRCLQAERKIFDMIFNPQEGRRPEREA